MHVRFKRAPVRALLPIVLASGLITAFADQPSVEAATPTWTSVNLPAATVLAAVACPTSTTCIAVGSDGSGGAAVTETNGTFQPVVNLTSPTGYDPTEYLDGISCPTASTCLAVGEGFTVGGTPVPVVTQASNGTFGPASVLRLPSNADSTKESYLDAIACANTTTCLAVGTYTNTNGTIQAMEAPAKNGEFGQGVPVTLACGAAANCWNLTGIACPSATKCIAVGLGGAIVNFSNGIERSISLALPPRGGDVQNLPNLNSIACESVNHCFAFGTFGASSGKISGMAVEITNGIFTDSSQIALPPNAADQPLFDAGGTACVSTTKCLSVGSYFANTNGNGDGQQVPLIAFESNGRYDPATEVPTPAGQPPNPYDSFAGQLSAVACPTPSTCLAVGQSPETQGWATFLT